MLQLKTQKRQLTSQRGRVSLDAGCLCVCVVVVVVFTAPPPPPPTPPPSPQIDRIISREVSAAKDALATRDKPRALAALRRKRLQEGAADRLDAHLLTLEQVLTHLEDATSTAAVMGALKAGNAALADARAALPLADVEAVLRDAAAAAEYERVVGVLLAEKGTDAVDEAAVASELAAMEAAAEDAEAAALPAVPAGKVERVAVPPSVEAAPAEVVEEERVAVPA